MIKCETQNEFRIMHVPAPNPRREYRLKQREQIEASPLLAKRFPELKALKVMLEYYDADGVTKSGEMKCKVNLEHARSALWFACPGMECMGGDFDLSRVLAKAAAERRKVMTGEVRSAGLGSEAPTRRRPAESCCVTS